MAERRAKRATQMREWRKKNPDYQRQQYLKHREKSREYGRDYYQLHKADLKIKREELKERMATLIGKECFICGKTNNLVFHEKNGLEHQYNIHYVSRNHENFVRLCRKCHGVLHSFLNYKEKFVTLLTSLGTQI